MEIVIAVAKGRLEEVNCKLFSEMGISFNENLKETRRLILRNEEKSITCLLVRPSDVPMFVEYGVADLGIVGKDVVIERSSRVKVVCDLDFGKCKFSVAGVKGKAMDYSSKVIKVATKYPNITQKYFEKKKQSIEILKLNGSLELAPLLGLSEVIVDIVETGSTLKANGLEVFEDILDINTQIISNHNSYILKRDRINELIGNIKTIQRKC